MKRLWVHAIVSMAFVVLAVCGRAQSAQAVESIAPFTAFKGEVLEVNRISGTEGKAMIKFRDLETGKTLTAYVDPALTVTVIHGEVMDPLDVMGGSRADVMYRRDPERNQLVLTFVDVFASF
jgi:hypothetical protein